MSTIIYYPGGYEPTAPAQNMMEEWNDSNQTYTSWDTSGNIILKRAYNAAEIAVAEIKNGFQTQRTNKSILHQKVATALTNNQAFLTAAANVTVPLTQTEQTALIDQVEALTRQMNALIYLVSQEFSDTITGI